MIIYLDMDGVIADFFGGVAKKYGVDHWKSIQHRDIAFADLRNTDFFNTLDTFKEDDDKRTDRSFKIVNFIKKLVTTKKDLDWGINSSPLQGDHYNSAFWKRLWLDKHDFIPPRLENLVFTTNKHKYAYNEITRKPNILIDDKPANISKWIKNGGFGIRFQNNEDDIEEYLFPEIEHAIKQYKRP